MRIRDGYKPKHKFSVCLSPATFEKLDEFCRDHGIHRTTFIEEAVKQYLDEKGVRMKALPARIKQQPTERSQRLLIARKPQSKSK